MHVLIICMYILFHNEKGLDNYRLEVYVSLL